MGRPKVLVDDELEDLEVVLYYVRQGSPSGAECAETACLEI